MANMVPDTIFPTDNKYDIPVLLPEMQAGYADFPFLAWGSVKRTSTNFGTWHFYVDDYRFSAIWDKADMIPATQCISVVEVNYTITDQMPFPVALWKTYQKRWLARYWQSRGVKIIVDLNVARSYRLMNMLGVPRGWKSFATHGYDSRIDDLEAEIDIAVEIAGTENLTFLVYGGGNKVREFCKTVPIVTHVEERRNQVKL